MGIITFSGFNFCENSDILGFFEKNKFASQSQEYCKIYFALTSTFERNIGTETDQRSYL